MLGVAAIMVTLASVSPPFVSGFAAVAITQSLAEVLIVWGGYDLAFLTLAAIAGAGFMLYWVAMPETAERS